MSQDKEKLESETLIEKRERWFSKLQITYDMIKNLPEKQNVFLARSKNLEHEYNKFLDIQDRLIRLGLMLKTDHKVLQATESYEQLYYEIMAKLDSIEKTPSANSSNNPSILHELKSVRPKLPPIKIDKFGGDLDKFPAFRSLFDTLVHDTDLPDIQKFAFLKSYLDYPALSVLDHYDFTSENYALAYKNLVERYTDVRIVGTHLLNKLVQFKPFPNGSLKSLRLFLDTFCVHYASLTSLEIPDLLDFIIFNMALKLLDHDTKRLFEEKCSSETFPTFDDLISFIKDQVKIASLLETPKTTHPPTRSEIKSTKSNNSMPSNTKSFLAGSQTVNSSASHSNRKLQCPVCKAEHKIYVCPEFLAKPLSDRANKVRALNLCFSCLGKHFRTQCSSTSRCRHCHSSSHHSLLHSDRPPRDVQSSLDNAPNAGSTTQTLSCRTYPPKPAGISIGLLSTVVARVQNRENEWISCRLVIDPASESSFITESFVQTLGLRRRSCPVDVVGIGTSSFKNHKGAVSFRLAPSHVEEPILEVDAIILSRVTADLPRFPLDPSIKTSFANLRLADPNFDQPNRIDILLGVEHYSSVLSANPSLISGDPAAMNSIFGYIIFGKIRGQSMTGPTLSFLTHTPTLDQMLQRFWEAEECCPSSQSSSSDVCEQYFRDTTTRDELGRYQVSLPFKQAIQVSDLGSTKSVAYKRLFNLERKFSRNSELQTQYRDNILDFVNQDHVRLASSSSEYLMTHHAVIKESSSTTKVRIVFNGSEKSNKSISLNDLLHAGPKLQSDISIVLLNFRLHPVTLISDIKQMFRCIRINPTDRKFVHFLWRENSSLPVSEWEFTTLPFGLTSSPYLAQRVLQQLIEDEGSSYPLASKFLKSCIYVDDLIISIPTVSEAIALFQEITELFQKGGFVLRKYSSNSSDLFSSIPAEHRENPFSFEESDFIKVLGLIWDPVSDQFTYKSNSLPLVPTKRGVLSQVARIFDIQGFISPVTFWLKHFIQKLWILDLNWDDKLPEELLNQWTRFSDQLPELSSIKIDRYLHRSHTSSLFLVGFSDASEKGFGACLYLVVDSGSGYHSFLLKAKSKVASIKPVTIPRLELNAAVLLSQLIKSTQSFRDHFDHTLICCTDSTVVLSWLHTPTYKLKTYVAHRVTRILDSVDLSCWWHVSGLINPADLASRGMYPRDLVSSDLWWRGPDFFQTPLSDWPLDQTSTSDALPEIKPDSLCLVANSVEPTTIEILLNEYSSLSHLLRILSWIRRFASNARVNGSSRNFAHLSSQELSLSMNLLVKWTQVNHYSDLFEALDKGQPMKGSLRFLTPFVDSDGFLRVGGRLSNSDLPFTSKHPLLLPRTSLLAKLICRETHALTLHGGVSLMQSLVYRKFWIPGVRYLLRSVIFHCASCYKFKAKPIEPHMSDLPKVRFDQTRAFINTGVDLAGPYLVKESRRRNARTSKYWIVVFVCMATRAIYLDLVSDLSSVCFLAALDRFIARRGLPSILCSDLGTNFVGAARELRELQSALTSINDSISHYCEQRDIAWRFNPPASPNFGGIWEAAVKSMKFHLRRVIGLRPLTQEELLTLLARVEGILNSRPLCSLSSTPENFDALTPGHFLVGTPMVLNRLEPNLEDQRIDYRSRWELLSRSVRDIWKRWSSEYLHSLVQRTKWTSEGDTVRPDQLVLVIEKELPPLQWSLGRVLEIIPSPDGVVRIVRIKTPQGVYTRPVNKLARLPYI